MVDVKAALPLIVSTLLILLSAYFIMRDLNVVKQAVLRISPEPPEPAKLVKDPVKTPLPKPDVPVSDKAAP